MQFDDDDSEALQREALASFMDGGYQPDADVDSADANIDVGEPMPYAAPKPNFQPMSVPQPRENDDPNFEMKLLMMAQKNAQDRRFMAQLGRAGDGIAASIAGTKPLTGFYDDLEKGADAPVGEYMQRHGLQKEVADRKLRQQQVDAMGYVRRKKADDDAQKAKAAAEEKQRQALTARAMAKRINPDIPDETLALINGPQDFSLYLLKPMEFASKKEKEAEAAKRQAERDAKTDAHNAATLGVAEKNAAIADDRLSLEKSEKAKHWAQLKVGGLEFDENDPPSEEGYKNVSQMQSQIPQIRRSMEKLRGLVAKVGTPLAYGGLFGEMNAERQNLADLLRKMKGYGVPNGQDWEKLAIYVPDVVGMAGNKLPNSQIQAALRAVSDQIDSQYSNDLSVYKYHLPRGGTPKVPVAGEGNSTAARGIPVRDKKTGNFLKLSPEDAKQAIQSGEVEAFGGAQ